MTRLRSAWELLCGLACIPWGIWLMWRDEVHARNGPLLLALMASSLLVAGCDIAVPTVPQASGSVCVLYPGVTVLADTAWQVRTDSTATCPDGSAPFLYQTEFVTSESDCAVSRPSQIYGGMKGIHRQFGCWKARPADQRHPI